MIAGKCSFGKFTYVLLRNFFDCLTYQFAIPTFLKIVVEFKAHLKFCISVSFSVRCGSSAINMELLLNHIKPVVCLLPAHSLNFVS